MCNIIHDIRVGTLKGTWHLTPQLAQSPKWTFEFTGPNQIPAIYFYIVLNKNWKYLVVWTIKHSFTGLGPEDQCSLYSIRGGSRSNRPQTKSVPSQNCQISPSQIGPKSNRPQTKSLYYYVFLFNLIICP